MTIEPSNMVIVAILNSILQFYPYDRGIYTSFTSAVRKNKVSKAPQDFYWTPIKNYENPLPADHRSVPALHPRFRKSDLGKTRS